MRDITESFVRERLEACKIRQDDYHTVQNLLSHSLAAWELEPILFWLDLNDEWPDAEWELPDFVKEDLREQAELVFDGERGPVPLPRGKMTAEKLKALWDHLNTAHKIEERFNAEHGISPSEFTRTLAISMWIEDNRGNGRPLGASNIPGGVSMAVPSCPACSGAMYDNRANKKNPKAPDFRCKNKECKDEGGYQTGTWERDYKGGVYTPKAPKPKPVEPPPSQPQPASNSFYDPAGDLPF